MTESDKPKPPESPLDRQDDIISAMRPHSAPAPAETTSAAPLTIAPEHRPPLVIGWAVFFIALAVASLVWFSKLLEIIVGAVAVLLVAGLASYGLEGRGSKGVIWGGVVTALAVVSFLPFPSPLRIGAIVSAAVLLVPYALGRPRPS